MKLSRSQPNLIRALRRLGVAGAIGSLTLGLTTAFPPSPSPLTDFSRARTTLHGHLQPEWPVSFNAGEAGRWLLQDGFDFSEPDGTWMTGGTAALRFRAPRGTSPVSIQLELLPFVPPGVQFREVRISSSIDDRRIKVYRGGTTLELALDGDEDQEVVFGCESVVSPTSSGVATDLRPLCLKILQGHLRYD